MFDNITETSTAEVTTTSRIKSWFMVQIKGYKIVQVREIPRVSRFGRLTYGSMWYLRSPEGQKQ